MLERFRRRTALVGIEVQTSLQEIHEKVQLLDLDVIHTLCVGEQPRLEVARWLSEV